MNESTLSQLRILIDRAVRPVRASRLRKRGMREEFLAHLSAVFEEEAARAGGPEGALERTTQRFGDPAALTGQLQESVPAIDTAQCFVEYAGTVRLMTWLRAALALFGVVFVFCAGGFEAVVCAVLYYLTADAVLDLLFPIRREGESELRAAPVHPFR
jgi:hypothetical protein